jgi:hypothetical protein
VNGTWTSGPPPNNALQTVLGALLIVLIILVGLAYASGRHSVTIQVTSSATPTPAATDAAR